MSCGFSSHQLPPEDPAIARQKIDEEIAQLEARIVTLKVSRNAFSPFARLHPEIIQDIFVLTSRARKQKKIGKTAFLLSWICHSWRNLAHQSSKLWSYIDFVHPLLVEAALSRTRCHQLYFYLVGSVGDFSPDSANPLAALCLINLPRIRTLTISSVLRYGLDLSVKTNPLWVTPAPLLVDLELWCMALPPDISFPALQKLVLMWCNFSWESLPIRAGFKHLSISLPSSKISAEDLVHKLQVIGPTVEFLQLNDVLLPTNTLLTSTRLSSQTRQDLPNLKSFGIYGRYAPPITFILDQFSLPLHTAHVGVQVQGIADQMNTIRAFVSCRGIEKWPVKLVNIHLQNTSIEFRIQEWKVDVGDAGDIDEREGTMDEAKNYEGQVADRNQEARSVSIKLECGDDLSDILPIFDVLPLTPIKVLFFSGNYNGDNVSALAERLDAQGAIEQLNIIRSFVPAFSLVMEEQIQQLRELVDHNGDIVEADLEEEIKSQCRNILTFHQLIVLIYYQDEAVRGLLNPGHFHVLREWLMWRRAVGLGLKTLVFENVGIPHGVDRALYIGLVEEFALERTPFAEVGGGSKEAFEMDSDA
ncbi:hypothetical protein BDN72DRAFT_859774 [Pluteus cervinus]|uniref:Uncharacterized protein n=1 Tax=Pluteus cervinus TaxID=181527 RepID=A0ACD3AM62_9AGAR|nr:hypothetical protein BDN72DRAFT_859774 [Pluteus cervinus]